MKSSSTRPADDPSSVIYDRCTVNLETGTVAMAEVPCANLEDVLGGFGRSFQMLAKIRVVDAYCPENPTAS